MSTSTLRGLSAAEREGLAALLACVEAAGRWQGIGPAARTALIRAHHTANGRAPVVPATIFRSTRAELVRAGLAFSDGRQLRVTAIGVRTTAWSLWLAAGDALPTTSAPSRPRTGSTS